MRRRNNFAEVRPSSIQGLAWEDFDDDGSVDFGEIAIEGAEITLSGTNDRGNSVSLTQSTDGQGIFEFTDLRPGTYSVSEAQPSGFVDGKDVVGEVDGVVTGDHDGGTISSGQTAGIGFWQNRNGQRLIESLNGSEHSTLLAQYLSGTFSNTYGTLADADGNGETGDYMTNDEVADFYRSLFKRKGRTAPGGPPKLDAQVMATALATYITKESLVEVGFDSAGSHTIDRTLGDDVEAFGFEVTVGGVGSTFVNVGDNGDAFGVDDDDDVQVIDLLLDTDARTSADGLLYDADGDGEIDAFEAIDRIMANDLYSLINEM